MPYESKDQSYLVDLVYKEIGYSYSALALLLRSRARAELSKSRRVRAIAEYIVELGLELEQDVISLYLKLAFL